tara:strand:- start:1359 stop:1808 length:450 start_codon:yes stop_codon:yes gene_type:complete
MKHTIKYKKITGHKTEINTVFVKMSRTDKQLLLDILQDGLYVICEAQHEFTLVNEFVVHEFKQLGKGKYYKNRKYIGIVAAIGGMLKQHKKTKDKDFTIHQIKNIEGILAGFDKINHVLKKADWPETIFAPVIEFEESEEDVHQLFTYV